MPPCPCPFRGAAEGARAALLVPGLLGGDVVDSQGCPAKAAWMAARTVSPSQACLLAIPLAGA
jgi:hypothetical protein